MSEININTTDIMKLSKDNIINKIKAWDTNKWKIDMHTKTTLQLYKKYKLHICEESWIDNSEGSKLLVQGRTNTLNLNWRNRFQNKNETCPCCDNEIETLEHFLLDCPTYGNIKVNFEFWKKLEGKRKEEKLANILAFENLTNEQIESRKKFIGRLWQRRKTEIR